ncbi:hypothetical protein P3T36_002568 [Kitasatospora sp. MAP12-15]|uniref:hypothetical protein n=1 Tax=unclassified Kitasatospora TaxID=2633591 RepID=UPI00247700D9|nr:hypothetical protein [Kitasatospora sp. MAP12-44]MDH6112850.1 hypothetical protein [Kitasatospora sp. MAP12-44]
MTGGDEQPTAGLPAQRRASGPRHAAPRTSGRGRARLLALAAVPTALLMGSTVVPNLAAAATTSGAGSCASAPDTATTITPVPKSKLTPVPDPTKASPTGTGGSVVSAAFVTPKLAPEPTPALAPGATAAQKTAAATQVVQAGAVQSTSGQDILGGIINGILGIFDPGHQNGQNPPPAPTPPSPPQTSQAPRTTNAPTATADPKPATAPTSAPTPAAPAAPAAGSPSAGPTTAPTSSAPATPPAANSASSAPAAPPSGSSLPTGTAAPAAAAKELAAGNAAPLCAVDTRQVAAAAVQSGQVVPDQNWTLNTSRLSLYGAVFGGVYEVHSPTGTKRVLKFTVSSVDIDNLDMSTIENTAINGHAETFHVKGAPGSTSTMRQGPIDMYVESLSGDLASLYGIPLPDLGAITITPDTLPQWLFNLIGAVPIPIDMALTKVTAIQAGQFGGTLHIPGMHMYNDNTPYPN